MTQTIDIVASRYYTVAEYAEVAGCSIYTACHRAKYRIPGAKKIHGSKSWSIPGTALLAFVVQDTSTTAQVKVQAGKPSQRARANV